MQGERLACLDTKSRNYLLQCHATFFEDGHHANSSLNAAVQWHAWIELLEKGSFKIIKGFPFPKNSRLFPMVSLLIDAVLSLWFRRSESLILGPTSFIPLGSVYLDRVHRVVFPFESSQQILLPSHYHQINHRYWIPPVSSANSVKL